MGLVRIVLLYTWDMFFGLGNLVFPTKAIGGVVPEGHPGSGRKWPEHHPPPDGASRCSCPGLNALANHGIISRDGRDINFADLNDKLQKTYNLSPTLPQLFCKDIADLTKRDYATGTFSLQEVDVHNHIEHDGSVTRDDIYFEPDTAKIAMTPIESLLKHASGKSDDGKTLLTNEDLAHILSERYADSKARNPEFTTEIKTRLAGYNNLGFLMSVFGGKVDDIRTFLVEERLPDGWEPYTKSYYGVTLGGFNKAGLDIAWRVKAVVPNSTHLHES